VIENVFPSTADLKESDYIEYYQMTVSQSSSIQTKSPYTSTNKASAMIAALQNRKPGG